MTAGYKLRYPDEALSEDDQLGAGGFADLIAMSPPPMVQQGTSSQTGETDRYERLISTARAAMAKRETQSKAGKGAKQKGRPTVEPPPKKTCTPTAALGRAPSDSETGTAPETQVSTPGETGVVLALGASSLDDYLIGRDPPTSGTMSTVGQVPPPGRETNPTVQGMGGFLAELKGMLPKAGPKKAPIQTLIPRRPGGKWIPVLGKPAPSVSTAALLLVPQQKTGDASKESTQSTALTRTDQSAPTGLEEPLLVAPAPATRGVCQTEPILLDAPDSTQVPVGTAEDTAAGSVETARTEETTVVVHREAPAAPVASSSGENTATPEAGPVLHSTAMDTVPEPCQEPLAVRDEENVPKMTGPVWEGAPVMLLQTATGLDPYRGQWEEPNPTQEACNVSSTPGVRGSEQEESAGNEKLPSVDSLEGQGSEGGDTPAETGTPHDESVCESTRDSSPEEEEADESQDPGSEPPEGDNAEQECEGPPDREANRDGDGQASDGSRGGENGSNNGDDQGGGQCQEGDNTEAEGKDEGGQARGARTTGSEGCARPAWSSWGEASTWRPHTAHQDNDQAGAGTNAGTPVFRSLPPGWTNIPPGEPRLDFDKGRKNPGIPCINGKDRDQRLDGKADTDVSSFPNGRMSGRVEKVSTRDLRSTGDSTLPESISAADQETALPEIGEGDSRRLAT